MTDYRLYCQTPALLWLLPFNSLTGNQYEAGVRRIQLVADENDAVTFTFKQDE